MNLGGQRVIDDAIKKGNFPVLDWPIEKIDIIKKHYKDKFYVVYLLPDNLQELKDRLAKDERDKNG